MSDVKKLGDAVESFQRAEEAITELIDEMSALAEATRKFEDARLDLAAARAELGSLATTHGELSKKLAGLSKTLAETTDVVRKVDPARLYSELGKIRQDYQAQIERMGKLSGDLSGKISTSAAKTKSQMTEMEERLATAAEASTAKLRRLGLVGIVLAVAILGLQITQLITG
jgi:chromosome segregation ATPase